ncbi:MAG: YdcH family protein [Woeseiaceae bacterium]
MDEKITEILATEGMDTLSKLKELRVMHRDLNDLIDNLVDDIAMDQIRLRRLKKEKLHLKDAITRLESDIIPDLNA